MNYPDAINEIFRQLPRLKGQVSMTQCAGDHLLVQALEAIITTDEAMRKNCERIQALKDKGAGGWIDLVASNCCKVTTSTIKQQEKE